MTDSSQLSKNDQKPPVGVEKNQQDGQGAIKNDVPALPIVLYTKTRWKEVLDTHQCAVCTHCLEDEDEMILHVIRHLPEPEREHGMNKLIAEKKKRDELVSK